MTSGPTRLTDLLLDQWRLFKGAGSSAPEARSPLHTRRSSALHLSVSLHPAEQQRSWTHSSQVSTDTPSASRFGAEIELEKSVGIGGEEGSYRDGAHCSSMWQAVLIEKVKRAAGIRTLCTSKRECVHEVKRRDSYSCLMFFFLSHALDVMMMRKRRQHARFRLTCSISTGM